ncbi:hypothetical protein K474DRAFT_1666462 [Panus rudis PR-1116 ss-1]|nr:hypothetical protein K474DRAFT_1666462 [Panus rudis PR-1116 ss-1]
MRLSTVATLGAIIASTACCVYAGPISLHSRGLFAQQRAECKYYDIKKGPPPSCFENSDSISSSVQPSSTSASPTSTPTPTQTQAVAVCGGMPCQGEIHWNPDWIKRTIADMLKLPPTNSLCKYADPMNPPPECVFHHEPSPTTTSVPAPSVTVKPVCGGMPCDFGQSSTSTAPTATQTPQFKPMCGGMPCDSGPYNPNWH